ncbi:hypothetical protein ASZ78_016018 [Callipepla squamata]|uniref:Ubiquitinyl hydrolase 1 n=1 Tax=Callipepla squamata TaxID=9009 RepID=A0A226NAB9_CALSU|nr:hypothetical protein ASZ78_016018 [Callipepla squamata]
MESEEEQHMTTLLCMGFSDAAAIRKALRLAKNDINEAVALLTNERPGLHYGGYEPMESGQGPPPGRGSPSGGQGPRDGDGGGEAAAEASTLRPRTTKWWRLRRKTKAFEYRQMITDPPCSVYISAALDLERKFPVHHPGGNTKNKKKNDENGNCSGEGIEFPTTNLYELESRVLTDHWSIPYKREESLGKCLIASTYLARLGLSDSDENCKRFMDRCMPEAFKKLLTSSAVHKWGTEIHEGIYNMLMLLVDLVAERVKQDPIPVGLLGVLTMAFNPDNEYHFKNRMKVCQRNWAEVFGEGNMHAVSPISTFQKEPHGWLVDLVNRFAELGGFSAIQSKLNSEDIELGVTKLIEDSTVSKSVKNAIDTDRLLNWLVENSVLSIALEGNIDQAQYCDRIKGIIELLGSKLSLDELTKIWRIQSGQSSTVIENIHTIIAAAAVKFSSDQLNHLFVLIQKVLEVLWELAHLPTLPCSLIQQALEEHLTILSDAYAVKEAIKRSYIIKCIEDIKRSIIQDLKKNFEIVKLVTGSLISCHRLAASVAGPGGLVGATLVDGRYTYREYLEAHLKFLAFFLQEATLYLGWNRAREIWECLVTGQDVCELDREMCFEWFTKGQHDLESDVQQQLFKEKILKLESYEITMNGFSLFKTFFENVNLCDHRLKRQGTQLVSVLTSSFLCAICVFLKKEKSVEKLELIGMDFIWKIAMESPDEEIANEAIQLIINYSYINLTPRLKKDSVSLHKKFIADCYTRLEAASSALGGPTLTHAVTRATKMLTATAMPTVATSVQSPYRSTKLVIIERLLLLAERYVITIEDLYSVPRTILPHGASFHGHLLTLNVTYESTKDTFTIEAHSNSKDVDNIQIFANDSLLTVNKDQKLLHQLGFSDEQVLTVKTSGSGTPSGSSADSSTSSSNSSSVFSSSYAMEQEKSLPGVVMALVCNVFDMLYQLANLEEPSLVVNVMQRDSIPSEVDYETRQGVYSICLQLARFLLVGQTMPTLLDEDFIKDGVEALSSRPFRNVSRQASRQMSICGTPEKSSYRQLSVSDRSSIRVEEIIPAARVAIQTMEVNDFTSTVACFMRLSWAAAAGRLDLVGSSQPIKENNTLFPAGIRNRLSSSGSNCSSGSEGEPTALHAGICVRQQSVSTKDALIAGEALSLLVTCLQLRSQQLGSFYNLPCVADFIIDILLGSPSAEIRRVACDQLYTLSQTDTSTHPDVQKPNQFLLSVILGAQLPLWSPTSIMRGINQRLLSQCTEYFDLRCQLLDDLTSSEMEQLKISPAAMLEDEITWLENFEPNRTAECETSEADNILLAGHLRLIKTLLSLCGAEKEMVGSSLIKPLLDDFLFRASRIILNSHSPAGSAAISQQDFHPKCSRDHQCDPALTKEFDIFKMWNKELYVREQQDAYEFFTSLIDQMDEYLKKIGRDQIFKNTFQGIFSDQKICKDCPHRYEREEAFMALNLGVTSCQSLEISLDQFVRGEVLEGSNAYYCEKCKEKFPWMLNMEPYTVSGMARQDSSSEVGDNGRNMDQGGGGSPRKKVAPTENYELVGVIVHSGQAHAGHYYSFIKDRRGCGKGKWYKFNDTVVEEFDLTDETLEYECFGGEYRPKVYDQSKAFYFTGGHNPFIYGIILIKPYLLLNSMVRDENLKFMKNRDVYSSDYFSFVLSLASLNATKVKHAYYPCMAKVSLQLAVQFLFQTYLRTKKKLRADTEEWIATIDALLSKSIDACQWLVEYFVGPEGRELVKTFLLECSVREVRVAVATILEKTLDSALLYQEKVMYALRELTGSLSVLIEMVVYCCFCNEHFSFTVLHFIKTQLETAPPHELKNIFQLLHEILVIEDPLQVERIKFAFETENGLIGNPDAPQQPRGQQSLLPVCQVPCYFGSEMSEHYWAPQSNVSNETSTAKTFQRTISAQDTLAYATALLNEKDQSGSSNGSESSPANENGDRHLQQGSESPMMIGETKSDLDDVDP